MDCFALLDDCAASELAPTSRLYTGFLRACRCDEPDGLDEVWAEVDREIRAGRHVVVLADYEWGARLLHAGDDRLAPADRGSLCFLIFSSLRRLSASAVDAWLAEHEALDLTTDATVAGPAPAGVLDIRPSVERDAFRDAIARIHAAITEGETYQVNYTWRLDFRVFGSPLSLYRRLRARQPVAYGALIALPPSDDGPTHVLSCSPELFLRHRDGMLEAKPMKGTASRAGVPEGDSEIARMLGGDAKNRAENLMIVDLLRNDLGRVARTGSVRVPALFSVESYPTVFQMTSTISAELPDSVGFPELLRALFPCGSITGAPKHRTMQLIADLETTPRGLYTGSIGWIDAPAGARAHAACGDFCLSVAIRTLTLGAPAEAGMRPGRLGIGAGIVIDSRADDEYEECRLKARFLTGLDPGFSLIETMHATREEGVRHLESHLARLARSAAELDFALPADDIRADLVGQAAALAAGRAFRLRLGLRKDGHFDLVVAPLDALADGPVSLIVAADAMDEADPLLRHKTTLRDRYDAAVAEATRQGAFDMLFHNRAGELTEGGRSNVFLLLDGEWVTPPLATGVLPGVMRSVLLEDASWKAREARVTLADLFRAERIVVCNALRGAREARLVERRTGFAG